MAETGIAHPTPRQVFDWVCEIRRAKLPDPALIGNAGKLFQEPHGYPGAVRRHHRPRSQGGALPHARRHGQTGRGLVDRRLRLEGQTVGHAGVYDKQALVLVNRGDAEHPCTGGEVMTLARLIQTSVYERFGIRLEPEPVVI